MTISRFTIQENDRIFNELFGHQDIKGMTPKGMIRLGWADTIKLDAYRCKKRTFVINGIEFKPEINWLGFPDGFQITNGDKVYKGVSHTFVHLLNGVFADPTTSNF